MNRILQAARFAADKHSGQRRKDADATPYINHPIEVAETLARVGKVTDEDLLVAALLHDTIEDTDTAAEEIERTFGKSVLELVLEVTDDKSLPKEERKRLQVVHAAEISPKAKQLKVADKICNLRSILNDPPAKWPIERQQEYFEWADAVFRGLRGVNADLDAEFERVRMEGRKRLGITSEPDG